MSLSTHRLSFPPFHPRPSNRGVGIALRLQVISGTRGKKSGNTIPLPKSFHFYFIFFFPLLYFSPLLLFTASSSSSSPLLVLLRRSLIRGIHPPHHSLGSTTPGTNDEEDPTTLPILPPRLLVIPAKKRRDPMRQRRWKRRRSDIFTGFTQSLQALFFAARGKPFRGNCENLWEAVNGKPACCYLIAKIPGNTR